jgi:predicted DNA-binding transcriptional regulator AlpA
MRTNHNRKSDGVVNKDVSQWIDDTAMMVSRMTDEDVVAVLGQVEILRAQMWLRIRSAKIVDAKNGDRLLKVQEAASKLGVSKDWLYRHGSELPFAMKTSPQQLRFSEKGIERYIEQESASSRWLT